MTLRRLGEGQPQQGMPSAQGNFPPQNHNTIMPAGPQVDMASVLAPFTDGSFELPEFPQAGMITDHLSPEQANITGVLPGTAPFPGAGQRPLRPAPGMAPTAPARPAAAAATTTPYEMAALGKVPPQLIHVVVRQMMMGLPPETQLSRTPDIEQMLGQRFMATMQQMNGQVPPGMEGPLYRAVLDEILGYGPLEALLQDDTISEIMVNGPKHVWVERKGHPIETPITFLDDDHVLRIAQRIIAPLGRRLDRSWPMVDARLPDGSRVNVIAAPCALQGTTITIRKFFKTPLSVENLIEFGTMTRQMADFLRKCVEGRLNMVIAGGTGSGKTTLLNVLSSFIPEGERIITIEDSAELRLNQRHVVSLESKPPDADNAGAVTIRHLVINALRMRPERIVVGECRSGETLDMLQAMNTGHDGSLTTLHANTPRDALSRIETMVMMAGMDLPVRVIREQVASAIDLVVQQARLRDGSRKITYITEVQGMEGDTIVLQDIFRFKETGTDAQGKVLGWLQPTGLVPNFVPRLEAAGQKVDRGMFAQR